MHNYNVWGYTEILPRKTHTSSIEIISIVYFLQARLFTEIFSRTITIHQGIFGRRDALIEFLRG